MNKVIMVGRLTKDPELRYIAGTGTPVAKFDIAVKEYRNKQEVTQFFRCSAFGKLGENLTQFQTKGNLILVEGKLSNSSYDAQDGTKRYVTEILANNIEYLNSKSSSGNGSGNYSYDNGGFGEPTEENGEMPF